MLSLRSILSRLHDSFGGDNMLRKLSMTVKSGRLLGKFVFDHLGLGAK
jgi:hypothetical protein